MNDIQTHLDKIRSDAAECVLLSNLVADGKGEVFARTAKHLSALALEIEKTIATNSADKGTLDFPLMPKSTFAPAIADVGRYREFSETDLRSISYVNAFRLYPELAKRIG